MLKYILKRLAWSVLILLGVSLIIYFLIRCMPVSFIDDKIAQMNQGGATIPQETIMVFARAEAFHSTGSVTKANKTAALKKIQPSRTND